MTTIDRLPPLLSTQKGLPEIPQQTPAAPGSSFGDTFKSFISDVNEMQVTASDKTMQFATGQIKDVHEVMAASEEAGISLSLLIEIRNKLLEGYKELSRIPV